MTASPRASVAVPPVDRVRSRRLPRLSRLSLLLYPFVAAAVAINLFLLSLMGQALGLPVLAPVTALLCAGPLGIPASYLAARWLRGLIAEAGGL